MQSPNRGFERLRNELGDALRSRQGEIKQVVLDRVRDVSDPAEIASTDYAEGLATAVSAALDYGIEALERSEERSLPIPTALLSQARLAARNRVSLDTVLRRYFAGYTLLGDFVIEETERAGFSDGNALKRLLRVHAAVFDRLLAAVTDEYNREAEQPSSSEERRARRIERLLAGEPLDTTEIPYGFEGFHLAVVGCGDGVEKSLRELAIAVDRNLLLVDSRNLSDRATWAWLGGRRDFEAAELGRLLSWAWPDAAAIAIGEPGQGLAGWRFSHRQAAAALPVAQRVALPVVRYSDVALLASALQDEVLSATLRDLYLEPLAEERDGGATLRRTLQAYFSTGRSITSTAETVGVTRKTAAARLHTIERRLGRPIESCAAEIETALHLQELRPFSTVSRVVPPGC